MLDDEPQGINDETLSMWLAMRPLSIGFLKQYWDQAEEVSLSDEKLFQQNSVIFDEWITDEGSHVGMRLVGEEKNGIVRSMSNEGKLREGTYKNDARHGLHRVIDGNDSIVTIEFYVNGIKESTLNFLGNFMETNRDDRKRHLSRMLGSDFNPRLVFSSKRGCCNWDKKKFE